MSSQLKKKKKKEIHILLSNTPLRELLSFTKCDSTDCQELIINPHEMEHYWQS